MSLLTNLDLFWDKESLTFFWIFEGLTTALMLVALPRLFIDMFLLRIMLMSLQLLFNAEVSLRFYEPLLFIWLEKVGCLYFGYSGKFTDWKSGTFTGVYGSYIPFLLASLSKLMVLPLLIFRGCSSMEIRSSSSSPLSPELIADVNPELATVFKPALKAWIDVKFDFLLIAFFLTIISFSRIWLLILVVREVFISWPCTGFLLSKLDKFGVSGYSSLSFNLNTDLISNIELWGDNCFLFLFRVFRSLELSDSLNLFFLELGDKILPLIRFKD